MINEDFLGTLLPNINIDYIQIANDKDHNTISLKYSFYEYIKDDTFSWSDLPPDVLRNIKISFRLFVNEEDSVIESVKALLTDVNSKAILKENFDMSVADLVFNKYQNATIEILEDSLFDTSQGEEIKKLILSADGGFIKKYTNTFLDQLGNDKFKLSKYLFLEKVDLLAFIYYDFSEGNIADICPRPLHIRLIKNQMADGFINNYKYETGENYYGPVFYQENNVDDTGYVIYDETEEKKIIEEFISFEKIRDIRTNKLPEIVTLVDSYNKPPKKEKYFSKLYFGLTEIKDQATSNQTFFDTPQLLNNQVNTAQLFNTPQLNTKVNTAQLFNLEDSGFPVFQKSINTNLNSREIFNQKETFINTSTNFNFSPPLNNSMEFFGSRIAPVGPISSFNDDYARFIAEPPPDLLKDIHIKGVFFFDYLRYYKENTASPFIQDPNLLNNINVSIDVYKLSIGLYDNILKKELLRTVNSSKKDTIIDLNNNYELQKITFVDKDIISGNDLRGYYGFSINVKFTDESFKKLKEDYNFLKKFISDLKTYFNLSSTTKNVYLWEDYGMINMPIKISQLDNVLSLNNTYNLQTFYDQKIKTLDVERLQNLLLNIGIPTNISISQNEPYIINDIIKMYLKVLNPLYIDDVYYRSLSDFFDSILVIYRKFLSIQKDENDSRSSTIYDTYNLTQILNLENYKIICTTPMEKWGKFKKIISNNKEYKFLNFVKDGKYDYESLNKLMEIQEERAKFILDYSSLFKTETYTIERDIDTKNFSDREREVLYQSYGVVAHVAGKKLIHPFINLNLNLDAEEQYFSGFTFDDLNQIINLSNLIPYNKGIVPESFIMRRLINYTFPENREDSENPNYKPRNFFIEFLNGLE